MKKILIALLLVLLLVLDCFAIFNGINLFGIEIKSIGQIKEMNNNLDSKIGQATTLASTDYPKILSNIETNLKKLEEEKKNYENMVTINNGSQVQLVNQYQKYEVEYLWTIIGNHATKEGVIIKIDIVASGSENVYNLNFTVNGSYIGITEFISDIENDSALGFKIENFSMKPGGSTQELQATFMCKEIEIKDINKSNITNTSEKNNANSTQTTNKTSGSNSTSSSTTTTNAETNTTNTTTNTATNTSTSTTTNTTNTTSSSSSAEDTQLVQLR